MLLTKNDHKAIRVAFEAIGEAQPWTDSPALALMWENLRVNLAELSPAVVVPLLGDDDAAVLPLQ